MNSTFQTLDLSRMYSNLVFQSRSAADFQAHLRQALNNHVMSWGPGEVDSALYSIDTRHLKLMILRYGPAVEIRPDPFDGFILVQVPLRGRSVIKSDGEITSIGPGQVAVLAPRHEISFRWSENCEQLILRVPSAFAREAASRLYTPLTALDESKDLAPVVLLESTVAAQWCSLVQSLVDQIGPGHGEGFGQCHPAWLEYLEIGLALLLLTQTHRQPDTFVCSALLTQSTKRSPLEAVRQYSLTHLWAPISLEDLARAAGISSRSLHTLCKREFGVGPMAWLRDIRLDEARRQIQAHSQNSITDIALAVGFGHLGRFSSYYKDRFGELPSATSALHKYALP
ncbi:AraC family transcriptional regulator [Pseudomonas sp. L13]|uniref:AraC family transcriptional regulator n=1 Tax=Pseudomonas sp. L13 TaxID=343985 RepID=UPI00137AAB96|nr:AraC family transcriptional regulator [Pseudomonas sp. L13]NCE89430.1 AraC family transcriptional regulator [Pseudomonas sp. L13]